MISLPLRCTYTFEHNDKQYVFDGQSMLLATVARPLRQAVELAMQTDEETDLLGELSTRFGAATAKRTIHALTSMFNSGFFREPSVAALQACANDMKERQLATSVLSNLELLVTGVCNLRCSYCYAAQGTFCAEGTLPFMTLSILDAALTTFLQRSAKDVFVSFLGGEPLLHPDFAGILDSIRRRTEEAGVVAHMNLSTNGTCLTKHVGQALVEHRVHVGVSIDGFKPTHDLQRPFANGSSSYTRTMDNLRDFLTIADPNRVAVRVTCTKNNIRELAEFFVEVRNKIGPISVEFAPVILASSHSCALNSHAIREFASAKRDVMKLESSQANGTPSLSIDEALRVVRRDSIHNRVKLTSKCEFGLNILTVTTEGDIYPCVGMVGDDRFRMGNVLAGTYERTQPVLDLYKRHTVLAKTECTSCWAKYVCAGGCPAANQMASGDPLKCTNDLCAIYKASAEATLLRFITLAELSISAPDCASVIPQDECIGGSVSDPLKKELDHECS